MAQEHDDVELSEWMDVAYRPVELIFICTWVSELVFMSEDSSKLFFVVFEGIIAR